MRKCGIGKEKGAVSETYVNSFFKIKIFIYWLIRKSSQKEINEYFD